MSPIPAHAAEIQPQLRMHKNQRSQTVIHGKTTHFAPGSRHLRASEVFSQIAAHNPTSPAVWPSCLSWRQTFRVRQSSCCRIAKIMCIDAGCMQCDRSHACDTIPFAQVAEASAQRPWARSIRNTQKVANFASQSSSQLSLIVFT